MQSTDSLIHSTGLCVARVKIIFTLPCRLSPTPTRLAYVEWFRRFKLPDVNSHLYSVHSSTRNHGHFAEVIALDWIVHSCHLVPKFGVNIKVTRATVFEKCTSFYLNPWIDFHLFCMFRSVSNYLHWTNCYQFIWEPIAQGVSVLASRSACNQKAPVVVVHRVGCCCVHVRFTGCWCI